MKREENKRQSHISENDLFEVARHLTVPTTVKFLAGKTGKGEKTLYRWLGDHRYLGLIVEHRNSMYWLRGHSNGQLGDTRIRVPMPQSFPDRFRDMYLKLGWRDDGQKPVSESYVLVPPNQPYPETDDERIPSEFRLYRDFVLGTGRDRVQSTKLDNPKHFAEVCRGCLKRRYQAPWIKAMCSDCKSVGSYDLVRQRLQSHGIEMSDIHTLVYLSYEYRKEMMIIIDHALRKEYENHDYDRFYRLRAALGRRYHKLSLDLEKAHTYDGSVEKRLGSALSNFVTVSANEAEEAIRISLDFCRWHQMNEAAIAYSMEQNPQFLNEQRKEKNRYEKTAEPILDKVSFEELP